MSEDPYSVPTGYVPRGPYAAPRAEPFDHAHPDSWKYEAKSDYVHPAVPPSPEKKGVYRLIDPQGRVRCDESSAVRAWARLGGYKSTVENLLAWEEEGWSVVNA